LTVEEDCKFASDGVRNPIKRLVQEVPRRRRRRSLANNTMHIPETIAVVITMIKK